MGSVYERGGVLWLKWRDATGTVKRKTTGLRLDDRAKADAVLKLVLADVAKQRAQGDAPALTVAAYAARWCDERDRAGKDPDDRVRLRMHVLPTLGAMPLAEVRPRHVTGMVDGLKQHLAPRTVRNVYGLVRTMFHDAVHDELISVSPCVLKRGTLPVKRDKDPKWRAGALFTHAESDAILNATSIPMSRRITYALQLLGGLRYGEVAGLTWADWDRARSPLGCLLVSSSFNTKRNRMKGTKTEQPREVPVLPQLKAYLDAWQSQSGGRGDALMCPHPVYGGPRPNTWAWEQWKADLVMLQMRTRRQHDMRRTFISLLQEDGAPRDVIEAFTHGDRGDIMSLYTTFSWATRCKAVMMLQCNASAPHDVGTEWAHKRKSTSSQELPRAGFEPARRNHHKGRSGEMSKQNAGESMGVLLRFPVRAPDCAQAGHSAMRDALAAAQRDGPGSAAVVQALGALGEALQRKGSG